MPNYSQRHSYYVSRTIKWMESLGLVAQKVEQNYTIQVGDKRTFVKNDMWGSDVANRCREGIDFVQVKTGRHQVAKGVAQLTTDADWPPYVGRYVIWWDKGDRLTTGPNVVAVSEGTCNKIKNGAKTYRTIG